MPTSLSTRWLRGPVHFTTVEYLEQEPRREPLELGALLRAAVEDGSSSPRPAARA